MIKTTISLQEVIALLNAAVTADPLAMRTLVETRVPCNKDLAEHPTIQVVQTDAQGPTVGILGILNGIFGIDDEHWGTLEAHFEVICPNGHPVPTKATVYTTCNHCGENLVEGKLLGFGDAGRR